MRTTVWKYPIPQYGFQNEYATVQMPIGAQILTVGAQGHEICAWARVDPSRPSVGRKIAVYGTGHAIADIAEGADYIGTVFLGPLVFHVFDLGESS